MASSPAAVATGAPPRSVERLFQTSLLGMVTCGYLAVAGSGYLDLPTLVLMALALLARGLIVIGLLRLEFPRWLVNVLTLAYVAFYPIDYLFISGEFLPATVHLVFYLAIVKIITAQTDRDYTYVKVIAFMQVLAASLLSANLNFFVFLALYLLFAVGTFTTSEVRRPMDQTNVRLVRSGLRGVSPRLALMTLFIFGGILTITGGLFFFLPRTARAAFQHLVAERYHLPGFSGEITLGQLGEIKSQSTPVMHVKFIKPQHSLPLKWRGMALGQFDGRRWYSGSLLKEDLVEVQHYGLVQLIDDRYRPSRRADRLEYEVHVKDIGTDTLFFAGVPEYVSVKAKTLRRVPGGSYRLPSASLGGLSYVGYSYLEGPAMREEGKIEPLNPLLRQEYLHLPKLDPRIAELAQLWTLGERHSTSKASAIEHHLKTDFGYSLTLLDKSVEDPLAHFLFERRVGHCEYFASSMAVMLRSIGIPSRVVTGFQSGIYNPISGWQMIRASDAHSWVEAYFPDRGWITFDPTPPDPNGGQITVWTKLALYMDAAETFWREWVLNYDIEHQLVLATRLQESSRSANWFDRIPGHFTAAKDAAGVFLKQYGAPLAAALVAVALLILYGPSARNAWSLRRRMKRVERGVVEQSDASLLYSRMLRNLERRGIEKPAWLTANEFARLIPDSEITPLVEDVTLLYNDLRFGAKREAGPRMLALIEQLESTPAAPVSSN
jgi:protein-glutamine gamma-glutamyltransferase